jgi:hypothetical protein
MFLDIEVQKKDTPSSVSLLSLTLKKDCEIEQAMWTKTVPLYLKHPEFVIKELVEMLEDIVPTGGRELSPHNPNGIGIYATENKIKLQGARLDPDEKKLQLLGTWASTIDAALTKYEKAQEYMWDLYKNEPERANEKMSYINKNHGIMPHWTSETDMQFLCAVSGLSYALTDAREELGALGQTTLPGDWSRTVAALLANLHVFQLMKSDAL